jgi:hypothetical protein
VGLVSFDSRHADVSLENNAGNGGNGRTGAHVTSTTLSETALAVRSGGICGLRLK